MYFNTSIFFKLKLEQNHGVKKFFFFFFIRNSISCTLHCTLYCTLCIINIRVHLKPLPPIFILAEGQNSIALLSKNSYIQIKTKSLEGREEFNKQNKSSQKIPNLSQTSPIVKVIHSLCFVRHSSRPGDSPCCILDAILMASSRDG